MAEAKDTKKNHSLRSFKGVNTQADRKVIDDDEFAWLENVMPIGNGNAKTVYGPSADLCALPGGKTCYYMDEGNIGGVSYMFMFCTDGSAYQVNLLTFAQTVVGAAGTFSGTHTRFAQWKNERIVLIDVSNGYFDWDGVSLKKYKGSIASVTIVNGGYGFSSLPTITPSSGSSTYAATIGVNQASIVAAGNGYWVGDALTTHNVWAVTQATFIVSSVDVSGAITGMNISSTGSFNFTQTFGSALFGGHGNGATVNISLTITDVTVSGSGSGYSSTPTLTVSNGGAGVSGSDLTASISGTTMTITHASSFLDKYIAIGQTVNGAGVSSGTVIVMQLSGALGLSGTWQVSISQTKADGVITTSVTGAVISANLNISAN